MIQMCRVCDKLLEEGQRIVMKVSASYHSIPSERAWAIDPSSLEAVPESIAHEKCLYREGD